YPSLLFLDNAPKSDTFYAINANTYDMQSDLADFVRDNEYTVAREHLRADGWSLAKSTGQALLAKLMATGTQLGEYVNGKIYRGVLTGYNEAFVIDEATRNKLIAQDPRSAEVIKPFLAGREIKRYNPPIIENYLTYIPWSFEIEKYPAIFSHLDIFKDKLSARPEVK
ncbi:MAG: restriction endonuclease subunit R, partial [Phototrophicales bacterium]